MMTTSYQELIESKEVKFSTVDKKRCNAYDAYVAILPTNVCKLSVRIQTKIDCVIVESPMFKYIYNAVLWYKNLSYIDVEMFAYLGYVDEENNFIILAEMEEKK